MRLKKDLILLCFLALLAAFILVTPVSVSPSPGIGFTRYKPTANEFSPDGFLTDPAYAYDWINATWAEFRPGSVETGYFDVYKFELASGYTAPPDGSQVAFVDFCMVQQKGGGGKGHYRIYYEVGLSETENILVNWTQTSYGSPTTLVWGNQFEPNDGVWDLDDIAGISVRVDTKEKGSGSTPYFYEHEVWVNVYYYSQPTLSAEAPLGKQTTTFNVDINVADADELYSWEFVLTYDTAYLTATDVVNSTFFDTGKNPRFWKLEVNDAIGRVWAAGSLTGDVRGQDGSGTLAVVSFSVDVTWAYENPNLLDLSNTKLNGYDYQNKRLFGMTHSVSDGYVTLPVHDVALTSVTPNATIVYEGWTVNIDVDVTNEGTETESFTVECYGNDTILLGSTTVSSLASGASTTASVTWDTTGFTWGHYNISAKTSVIANELHTADNIMFYYDDMVYVKIPGDVSGNGIVSKYDLVLIDEAYGCTFGTVGFDADCDINKDNIIDVYDLNECGKHYGKSI